MSQSRCVVLSAILLLTIPSAAFPQVVDPDVFETIDADGVAPVIVLLRSAVPPTGPLNELQAAVAEVQDRVLAEVPPGAFDVVHVYESLAALAGMLNAEGLGILLAHPDVERIGLSLPGEGGQFTYIPFLGASNVHTTYGIKGDDVIVVVIDSGVDRNHVSLPGAVIAERCWCTRLGQPAGIGCCPNGSDVAAGTGSAFDNHGHGTHITGIIRSRGYIAPIGMAPEADIIAIKVLDGQGITQNMWDVVAALNWVATNRPDADAVNMSLGSNARYPGHCDGATTETQAFANIIATLEMNGTAVFAASMNNGSATTMSSPACVSPAIAVGATTWQDQVASFSNSSSALDFLAPGHLVVSAMPGTFATGTMTGT